MLLSRKIDLAKKYSPIVREKEYLSIFFFGGDLEMKENEYQAKLIKKLKKRFPESYVIKEDASYIQGIPDLLVLYKDKWGTLEVKASAKAAHQPNQDYHVKRMNDMSFSSFICPETEKEVLDEMERSLKA